MDQSEFEVIFNWPQAWEKCMCAASNNWFWFSLAWSQSKVCKAKPESKGEFTCDTQIKTALITNYYCCTFSHCKLLGVLYIIIIAQANKVYYKVYYSTCWYVIGFGSLWKRGLDSATYVMAGLFKEMWTTIIPKHVRCYVPFYNYIIIKNFAGKRKSKSFCHVCLL